ncbi:MAG: DUF4317 domain-containing protein [Firmicutes bacterium]|nr:DUF4317 domain-containing protein [Bacillota bacterium]
MTEKEISEIRRRFRADRTNITRIRGCYVNEKREIISQFSQPIAQLSQEETEELLAILKKTLSGTPGRNLIDIEFETRQVMEGEEHRLLMTLRSSGLDDEEAVGEFYRRVISSLSMDGNYLILLCSEKYDVPSYAKDGEKDGESSEVFNYILCSVCPVRQTKPLLSYYVYENRFRNLTPDWIVAPPQLGFLFPAFDDRSANIYNALYYTRDCAEIHEEFTDTVFRVPAPMPAAEQKETFQSILAEAVCEDCSYDVVQSVHEQLSGLIEEHKANKVEEPLVVSGKAMARMLESGGVSEEHAAEFEEKFDDRFGEGTEISPRNLIDTRQFRLSTPDVTIKVNPDRSDLVETRIIDGVKYILIRAEDGVEVNGINIRIR